MERSQVKWLYISVGFSLAVLIIILYLTINANTITYIKKINPLFLLLAFLTHILTMCFWAMRVKKMSGSLGYPIKFFYSLNLVFANLLAWFYAAPPFKLSYHGLGEFGNTAIGFLFPGLGYFAMMGTIDLQYILFSIPILFLQLLFTISVEIPDMEADRMGGKMTWIASRGREFGFKIITISALCATVSLLILAITHMYPPIINFNILAAISLIPLSLGIIELIKKPLNRLSATKYCIYNLTSIFGTVIVINCYFIFLIK